VALVILLTRVFGFHETCEAVIDVRRLELAMENEKDWWEEWSYLLLLSQVRLEAHTIDCLI
jgi:hypothetical protein